jgi:hypothetical protein
MRCVVMLYQQHPILFPMSIIQGYQLSIPNNITLLKVQDLDKIGLVDLVILGWLC